MDQASNVRETAAFARRLVCRALTVAACAAAGTAIAWCLSTASASADTPLDLLGGPVGEVSPVLAELVAPAGETLDALTGNLPELSDPPPAPVPATDVLERIGHDLARAARQAGERPASHPIRFPGCGDRCAGGVAGTAADEPDLAEPTVGTDDPGPAATPVAASGYDRPVLSAPAPASSTIPVTTPAPVPASAGLVSTPGTAPEWNTARIATAYVAGTSRRGPAEPNQPGRPAPRAPVLPSTPLPSQPGKAGGSQVDAPVFATVSFQDRAPGPPRGLTVPAADEPYASHDGARPGVAPD